MEDHIWDVRIDRFWNQVTSSGIVSKVYHTIDYFRYFMS
ncbi:hypothetical protein F383_25871 [Gossypium arboreum]|uniref:Uncharacterized protein n=1 Tax=Gossypium arboreum TaxID=29729 RepID=A0A0B0P401_GOSAR|nr:hypothetical protein F383_25871 [Gossypium arboreum]